MPLMTQTSSLFWFPDAFYTILVAGLNAWYTTIFGLTRRTCVSNFFSLLFCNCSYKLIFKVNEHGFHLQGVLRTFLYTFTTAIALLFVEDETGPSRGRHGDQSMVFQQHLTDSPICSRPWGGTLSSSAPVRCRLAGSTRRSASHPGERQSPRERPPPPAAQSLTFALMSPTPTSTCAPRTPSLRDA